MSKPLASFLIFIRYVINSIVAYISAPVKQKPNCWPQGKTEKCTEGGGGGVLSKWDDGVAQLVKHRIRDPKIGGSNPACVRSTRKICESFSESQMC